MEQPTLQDIMLQLDKLKLMVQNYRPNHIEEIAPDFRGNFETILLEKYNIDLIELRKTNRNATLVMLRFIYCYGLRKHYKYGWLRCGLIVGYKDHSNAIYAYNKVESMLKIKDALFMEVYANFEHLFKDIP